MKNKKITIIIGTLLILFVGLALRLYLLEKNVPTLYADETGGHYYLMHMIQSGDLNPLGWLNYATFTFTWFLGLTPLGVRLAPAIYGSVIGLVIFYFSYYVSEKRFSISFLAGILGALLPWSFMISRIGHTHVPIIVIFSCLHLGLLMKSKSLKNYLISLLPLAIAVYYYSSMVVIAPISILLVLYFASKTLDKRNKKIFVAISAVVLGLVFIFLANKYQIFDPKSRGLDLAIWRDINVTADTNLYRGYSRLSEPTLLSFGKDPESISNKIFYNYPVAVINVFVRNYLSFFSPDFLFLKGDGVLRHSTGMVGEFFTFLLPFMIFGAYKFFVNADKKTKAFFIVWILISPIPAAITKDGATYLLRVITLMPFLTYFSALGITESFSWIKNKSLKIIYGISILLIGLFSVSYFYYGYFHVYPSLSVDSWEFGFKEIAEFTKQSGNPQIIVVWDDSYPVRHFCFWNNLPFDKCQNENVFIKSTIGKSTFFHPLEYLHFSLPNTDDLSAYILENKIEYIAIPKPHQQKYASFTQILKLEKSIIGPDGNTAVSIYSVGKK